MLAAPTPVLQPPVVPLVVRRGYRDAAPYHAGGRRSVRLAAHRGARLVAPCAGRAAYVGGVAGRAPVVTIACARPPLRVTISGIAASVDPGGVVRAGASIGRSLGDDHIGISVRRAPLGYVDPLPLLRRASSPPPASVPIPRLVRRSPPRIAQSRLDRALRTLGPEHAHPSQRGEASERAPDVPMGVVGVVGGVIAMILLIAPRLAARRRVGSAVAVHRIASRR